MIGSMDKDSYGMNYGLVQLTTLTQQTIDVLVSTWSNQTMVQVMLTTGVDLARIQPTLWFISTSAFSINYNNPIKVT